MKPNITEAEAREIMAAGLAKAELEIVTSFTSPLYWVISEGEKQYRVRNGSAFFLNTGAEIFGVTAAHVIDGWREDCRNHKVIALQIGHDLAIDFKGKNALIDENAEIDIATFRITEAEIKSIKKMILTGYQKEWPPLPPEQDKGIYYTGFPSITTIRLSPNETSFGACPGGGIANSISEKDVSTLIERQHIMDVMGKGLPPENFDFRGMSGGPMLTVIESKAGIRSWTLAGVIYQGPNTSEDPKEAIAGLEIIKARRAHFILPDGQLDLKRWSSLGG